MKVYFHDDFYSVYTMDPAAAEGRMEAVVEAVAPMAEFVVPDPAPAAAIAAVHTASHIATVKGEGLYDIAALAAGGAIEAARTGLQEPAFACIRPPGHHASGNSAWGFCFFNNMSIALTALKQEGLIKTAFVLDFDYHFGDGNVNILGDTGWVTLLNPSSHKRESYLDEVKTALAGLEVDIIGISAGFDHHIDDWGGLLETEDYTTFGTWVRRAAERSGGGCFALLEGGYNHDVLGTNVAALLKGMMAG